MANQASREPAPEAKLIRAFMTGVHTLVVEHLNDTVSVGEMDEDEFDPSDVVGVVSFDGSMVGEVRVRFPDAVARAIVSRYTGLDEVPDAIFEDAVGELCNVIIGRAKSGIGGDYISMSPPTIENGRNSVRASDGSKRVACETSFGRIWILFAVRLAGRAAA